MGESSEYTNSWLIEKLILLRKEVPRQILDIYARQTVQLLKNLENVKIELQKGENEEIRCQIPDNLFKEINVAYHDAELYEQIHILHVFKKMKNNPTSKLIDEI